MNVSILEGIDEVLDALNYFTDEHIDPPQAVNQLAVIEQRHPALKIELIWQTETYDHSIHYDALLRIQGKTISLSVASEHRLPWPLRGVRRWSEANLLQVNGQMLTMQDAIHLLDVVWNEAPVMARLVDACLLDEELQRDPVTLDEAAQQTAVDEWRRARGLYSVSQTEQWMQQRGLTHEQLESFASEAAILTLLRKRIAGGSAIEHFRAHRREFDVIHVAQIDFTEAEHAASFRQRLLVEPRPFVLAMQDEFLLRGSDIRCQFTTLRRRDCSTDWQNELFDSAVGTVVSTIRDGHRHAVACTLQFSPAIENDSTMIVVEQDLFDRWLTERRERAVLDWHWGRRLPIKPLTKS